MRKMKGSEIANQLVPDNSMSVRNDVEPRTLLGVNGLGVSKSNAGRFIIALMTPKFSRLQLAATSPGSSISALDLHGNEDEGEGVVMAE